MAERPTHCRHCHRPITQTAQAARLYCDKACARGWHAEQKRLATPAQFCPCGQQLHLPARGRRPEFCSGTCRWRARREARPNELRFSPAERLRIFERDAWECGICHGSIDPDLTFPHLESATVDHIIELSRGGAHTMANAQAAHFLCNIRKGRRLPVERVA